MQTKKEADLYVRLKPFQRLVERTSRFIADSLEKVQNPYVACSFGKDSSVMLHLVLHHQPAIPVKFLGKKETPLIDDYDSVIKWWESRYPIQVERITYVGWLEDRTAKTGIKENVSDAENDSYFVGLRMDESVPRRISLKTHGMFHQQKSGKVRIAPLADWTVRDIAAYMLHYELPILAAYKREGFEARTTSNIPSKYPHESLARLKDADPGAYNELLQLFPDAKYYT